MKNRVKTFDEFVNENYNKINEFFTYAESADDSGIDPKQEDIGISKVLRKMGARNTDELLYVTGSATHDDDGYRWEDIEAAWESGKNIPIKSNMYNEARIGTLKGKMVAMFHDGMDMFIYKLDKLNENYNKINEMTGEQLAKETIKDWDLKPGDVLTSQDLDELAAAMMSHGDGNFDDIEWEFKSYMEDYGVKIDESRKDDDNDSDDDKKTDKD